jgi:hypothetical protein
MGGTWLYVLIGVGPWVVAWAFYLILPLFRRPKVPGAPPLDPAAQAARHQKWLDLSLREQIEAEALAEDACVRAEAAAAASGGTAGVRKAAETAAKEAEAAAAAATAADILARRRPDGRSEKAEDFAARAAQAAAMARAAADALTEAQPTAASDTSPGI